MGRFWAVGVGPGDPELLTVKAVRLVRSAHVLYHAGPARLEGRAWDVVRHLHQPGQEVRVVRLQPMGAINGSEAAYREGAERIAADCRAGRDVVFVTEGDPTLYSTATPVWELVRRLCPEVPVEVVPGVTSVTAAAARVGWPLARRGETLAVVPAGYQAAALRGLIESHATVCFLKVKSALGELREALRSFGERRAAVYVEDVGLPSERVQSDLHVVRDAGYFSLVLVRSQGVPVISQGANAPRSGTGGNVVGKVWVVGTGPGSPRTLTRQALTILRRAEVIIGYDGYLKPLAALGLRAEFRGSPIGAEAERAVQALQMAQAGRRVALVSSGDAGVYGMGSLLLEKAADFPGVEVEAVPGVTAAVAAAARLGAPLGHDFACVSLSDLLTPWEVIERRLAAAGQADLVLALYNPVSRRRTWQLPRAREVLLHYRSPETPVGLVDRAYRPGERAWLTTLADLTPNGITMETTAIVGSTRTRVVSGRLVTPRGYGERP